jgi:hypothetical protein
MDARLQAIQQVIIPMLWLCLPDLLQPGTWSAACSVRWVTVTAATMQGARSKVSALGEAMHPGAQ